MDALEINDVRKLYGRHQALAGVTITVPMGSVFGLLGPNGAGKTTLFSVVAGFVNADSGSVRVMGHHHRDPAVLRGKLGILPQDSAFQSDISILDQLVYFLRLAGRSSAQARREVATALDSVGLGDWLGRRSTELSHGMYKRLCLAQAFLGDPDVVLLDEPTAGLDPANAARIRDLIRTQAQRRAAVVVSSHDMTEMQDLCSHVAIMKQGGVVSCGPLEQVTRNTGVARLLLSGAATPAMLAVIAAVPAITAVTTETGSDRQTWIVCSYTGDATTVALAVQAACLAARQIIRRWDEGSSLERHYFAVTKGDGTTRLEPQVDVSASPPSPSVSP